MGSMNENLSIIIIQQKRMGINIQYKIFCELNNYTVATFTTTFIY